MNEKDIITNAPKDRTIGPMTALNPKAPFQSANVYPGDSVDEHKKLESANHHFNEKEIGQQNENL